MVAFGLLIPYESANGLSLAGVTLPRSIAFDGQTEITVAMRYPVGSVPSLVAYNVISTSGPVSGWRSSDAQINLVDPTNSGFIFFLTVLNRTYNESLPFSGIHMFYLEACDLSGNSLVTSKPEDRWNPMNLDGNFLISILDPYRPIITIYSASVRSVPSVLPVTITANVTDVGTGVANVTLTYWVGDGAAQSLPMTDVLGSIFQAKIGPQHPGAIVSYYVTATDNAGNSARSEVESYSVEPPPWFLELDNRPLIIVLFAVVVVTVGVAVRWGIRFLRPRDSGHAEQLSHPTASSLLFFFTIGYSVYVFVQLATVGAPFTGVLMVCAMILPWLFADTRFSFVRFVPKIIDRNPPLVLILEALSMLLVVAAALFLGLVSGVYGAASVALVGQTLGQQALVLLALGMILQYIWPSLKKSKLSIEWRQEN